MKSNSPVTSTLLFLVGLASLGVVVLFLFYAAATVNVFFMALLIVITVSPVMYRIQEKGAPAWVAFVGTLLVLLVVLVIFVLIVVGAGQQFVNTLPEYLNKSESTLDSIQSRLESWGIGNLGLNVEAMVEVFNPAKVLNLSSQFVAGLVESFSNVILIGMLILFMLVDAIFVPFKIAPYINSDSPFILRLREYTVLVRRYIGITTIVGTVTGILDTILFFLVGVDFALLWGVIAFLFSFIPTIGFWIALIPPVTLAFLQFGFPTALVVFFGIVLINGFAENIVKPRYMGAGLNLSFFTVFYSVVIWSAILGSLGAILSIPLTLAFKVLILDGDERGRWFFDLLSENKRPKISTDTSETKAEQPILD